MLVRAETLTKQARISYCRGQDFESMAAAIAAMKLIQQHISNVLNTRYTNMAARAEALMEQHSVKTEIVADIDVR